MDPFSAIISALAGAVPCLFFVAVAAMIIVAVVWAFLKARQRREAMARLAAGLGLEYYPDDPYDLPARYAHFNLFDSGHSRKASNVLSGTLDGRPVLAFDYQYTTGSGKNRHTHCYQAAVIEMPVLAPRLELRSESVFDTLASWVGYDDIDFESEQFSKRYHVKCDERKFAYDIFHARLIDWLLRCGDVPTLEMRGPILLTYDSQGGVEQVQRLLAVGQEIVGSIPEYVLHERGTAAKRGGKS
jgi:hypothetical protein